MHFLTISKFQEDFESFSLVNCSFKAYLEFQAGKVQPELIFPEIRVSNTIEACLQTE